MECREIEQGIWNFMFSKLKKKIKGFFMRELGHILDCAATLIVLDGLTRC